MEENKALARRYMDVVNSRQLDRLDALLPDDYVHHDPSLPPELLLGRDGHKRMVGMFLSAYPDLVGTIDELIAEGDRVVIQWTYRGTQRGELMGIPPTGKQVTIVGIQIMRIAGDRIVEGWVNFDALGMLRQLGAIPQSGEARQ